MKPPRILVPATLMVAIALVLLQRQQGQENAQVNEEKLWQHRNLGKAFYENPTTQQEAVAEFKAALDLAPQSARERLNYGLALLRAGKTSEGIAELEKAQKQDPKIPHTWFNLGIAYKKNSEYDKAIAQLERMARLAPDEPKTHYNLGTLYKLNGKVDEALKEFEKAEKLDPALAGPHFQLYNAYRQAGRAEDGARELKLFQAIKDRAKNAAIGEDMEWSWYAEIYETIEPKPNPAPEPKYRDVPVGVQASGVIALDYDGDGRPDSLAWSSTGAVLLKNATTPVSGSGLEGLKGVVSIAAGDFDNDGLPDLCVLTESGPALYSNKKGKFEKHSAPLPSGRFESAVWIDYDHDYDLDLVLLGESSKLVRNNGAAGFSDQTAEFPFVKGHALSATLFSLISDTSGTDLVVSYADRAGVLYRDKLSGKFEASPLDLLPAGARSLVAADLDNDGWIDLEADGKVLLNHNGVLAAAAGPNFRARDDYSAVAADGTLHLFQNQSETKNWLRVGLTGVKNLKLAPMAMVEVKAGTLYRKKIYNGIPLTFDLGPYNQADTVRITWPNGLIQNETKQAAGKSYTYKEAQRLSGSCPMIFTWDGKEFRFLTDVLGVAPLGASAGDGKYFPVDHDEYVFIPGEALAIDNGHYEIRITEELREVSYLDQVRLIALDHPAQVDVFTNDKFKSPPFPNFRLFGASKRLHAVKMHAPDFPRSIAGVAALHTVDLDFGNVAPDNKAALILKGWVDWADGSTFRQAAQESREGLILPYLQVKDAAGQWRTVIEDMGLPAGKPKTIAVDLTGKFLSASREVRIVTNLCIYWDDIFLTEDSSAPEASLTPLDADFAALRFRGFSKATIDPRRRQPEWFDYAQVSPASMWNPTPGMYTRYGDVKPLVAGVDDRLLIMGSGDELKLRFPAERLPAARAGWKRDFLLLVDGWAKDGDANTAYSQSVTPLPFHGMSQYPYSGRERFPESEIQAEYTTRPALRLLRPLAELAR